MHAPIAALDASPRASAAVQKRRILIYAAVDCSHPGGVQTVVSSLVDGLRDAGHLVPLAWSEPSDRPIAGQAVWRLHTRALDQAPYVPRRRHHLPSLARLSAHLARHRPEVVNVHFATRAAHCFLALRSVFGYRLVLSVHGSDLLRPWEQDRPFLPSLLRQADAVTAVSEDLRQKASHIGAIEPDLIEVIPNGVDTDFWSPLDGVGPDNPAAPIVAVGRLERVKGFDVLLEAFAALRSRGIPRKLCIIGDGSESSALMSQAAALQISKDVEFAGSLPPREVRNRIRGAAAFVLSSRSEGAPLSLLEAMACGVPCVASRVGGVPELAGEGAILVPPEAPVQLADGLAVATEGGERATQLRRQARQRAVQLSCRRATDTYERVYHQVLGGRG